MSDMNGSYRITLPLPGKDRSCRLDLTSANGTISGFLQNPYAPEQMCPIYDGTVSNDTFSLKAMVGRTEFVLQGTLENVTFTTHETIPLDPGQRLRGISGQLAGEYLVGVYSPGGIRENHFVIAERGQGYTGEMFGVIDQKSLDFMAQMMGTSGPKEFGPPPGAAAPGGAPPSMPKLGDKTDVNPFISVKGSAERFEIQTRTGNGSLFVFTGSVTGNSIQMTLHVTDQSKALSLQKL
jgi:hypothetical protein